MVVVKKKLRRTSWLSKVLADWFSNCASFTKRSSGADESHAQTELLDAKKLRRCDLHARIEVWREGVKSPIDALLNTLPKPILFGTG